MTLVTRFLNLFYVPTLHDTPRASPRYQEPTPRERLEIQARPIVAAMGSNPDTVKYMSDGLLMALINDYIKCNR